MKSSKIIPLQAQRRRRERDELAFLPAALEIIETPPSPLGRTLALVIAAVFCAAIAWSAIALSQPSSASDDGGGGGVSR